MSLTWQPATVRSWKFSGNPQAAAVLSRLSAATYALYLQLSTYLEAVWGIRNRGTRHAVVRNDTLT
jgi:hypothetical protein